MMDYTKQKNRIKALGKLNADCLEAFKGSSIKLSANVIISVTSSQIEISYREQEKKDAYFGRPAFASEIRIVSDYCILTDAKQQNTISVGSCGSFTPENIGVYWRTIHAAEILKNWKAACDIVNLYCKKYRELSEEINQLNKG